MESHPSNALPKNSKGIQLTKGQNYGTDLFYCGQKFTSYEECVCKSCDGNCGPDNGCPCPECDYILSNYLYSSGKMFCAKCKSTLIRIPYVSLKNLESLSFGLSCTGCSQIYCYGSIPVMYCFKCKYNLCPPCALKKADQSTVVKNKITPHFGKNEGEGLLYCGQKFTEKCLCGNCDGKCGPNKGCPCPICNMILGYNIYMKNRQFCQVCEDKPLLVRLTLKEIQAMTGLRYCGGAICNICNELKADTYKIYYHCMKCDYDVCQKCASKNISINSLIYPTQIKGKEEKKVIKEKTPISKSQETKLNKGKETSKKKEEISEEDRQKLENLKCIICMESDKCILFRPCNHMACCEECANLMDKCPMCREEIKDKLKIFI